MTKKINWVDEILATHNVENEPLLEEQLELFKKDIIKEHEQKQKIPSVRDVINCYMIQDHDLYSQVLAKLVDRNNDMSEYDKLMIHALGGMFESNDTYR